MTLLLLFKLLKYELTHSDLLILEFRLEKIFLNKMDIFFFVIIRKYGNEVS